MKFTEFGWNGLFFKIPEEMRFVRHGGNAKTGHFSLQAEDCAIEAKWESLDPKKMKSLSSFGESMVKQMEKTLKRKKLNVLKQESTHASVHDALYMVVDTGAEDRFYVWYCEESQRVLIFRFIFKAFDESGKKILKEVFDTLRCHGEGSDIWSLLSLRFETPSSFLLTETKIAVGRAHFMLTDLKVSSFAERTQRIMVEYFSMANLVFKENYRDPEKWFEEDHLKELRKNLKERKIRFETVESGTLRRHRMIMKRGTTRSGTTWRRTTIHTNATWYCSGTNRIYSVTVSSTVSRPIIAKREIDEEAHTQLLEELLASFSCH